MERGFAETLFDQHTVRNTLCIDLKEVSASGTFILLPDCQGKHPVKSFYLFDQDDRFNIQSNANNNNNICKNLEVKNP